MISILSLINVCDYLESFIQILSHIYYKYDVMKLYMVKVKLLTRIIKVIFSTNIPIHFFEQEYIYIYIIIGNTILMKLLLLLLLRGKINWIGDFSLT